MHIVLTINVERHLVNDRFPHWSRLCPALELCSPQRPGDLVDEQVVHCKSTRRADRRVIDHTIQQLAILPPRYRWFGSTCVSVPTKVLS